MTPEQTKAHLTEVQEKVDAMSLSELKAALEKMMGRHDDTKGSFAFEVAAEGPLSDNWFIAQHQIYRRRAVFLETGVGVLPDGSALVMAVNG